MSTAQNSKYGRRLKTIVRTTLVQYNDEYSTYGRRRLTTIERVISVQYNDEYNTVPVHME